MNEGQKTARAQDLLTTLNHKIRTVENELIILKKNLDSRRTAGVRLTGEELASAAVEIRRIARLIEPANKRCARTCPELCPNHQQLKLGG